MKLEIEVEASVSEQLAFFAGLAEMKTEAFARQLLVLGIAEEARSWHRATQPLPTIEAPARERGRRIGALLGDNL